MKYFAVIFTEINIIWWLNLKCCGNFILFLQIFHILRKSFVYTSADNSLSAYRVAIWGGKVYIYNIVISFNTFVLLCNIIPLTQFVVSPLTPKSNSLGTSLRQSLSPLSLILVYFLLLLLVLFFIFLYTFQVFLWRLKFYNTRAPAIVRTMDKV